jgi:alkyl sulfatase BDS1-like metallo-beta-lactamase superfamily hydrolase
LSGREKPKKLLAQVYEKLVYATENAVWWNFCLAGAMELREGVKPPSTTSDGTYVKAALSVGCLAHPFRRADSDR